MTATPSYWGVVILIGHDDGKSPQGFFLLFSSACSFFYYFHRLLGWKRQRVMTRRTATTMKDDTAPSWQQWLRWWRTTMANDDAWRTTNDAWQHSFLINLPPFFSPHPLILTSTARFSTLPPIFQPHHLFFSPTTCFSAPPPVFQPSLTCF